MMSLPDGTSFMTDIQDYMKYIIKKNKKALIKIPPIHLYLHQ